MQVAGPFPSTEPVSLPGSWGKIFDDPIVAAAMLDRLSHRNVVFNIDGESYRMRSHRAAAEKFREGDPQARDEGCQRAPPRAVNRGMSGIDSGEDPRPAAPRPGSGSAGTSGQRTDRSASPRQPTVR